MLLGKGQKLGDCFVVLQMITKYCELQQSREKRVFKRLKEKNQDEIEQENCKNKYYGAGMF
jgi:hypothetical protein